jgi:hypothetical protein
MPAIPNMGGFNDPSDPMISAMIGKSNVAGVYEEFCMGNGSNSWEDITPLLAQYLNILHMWTSAGKVAICAPTNWAVDFGGDTWDHQNERLYFYSAFLLNYDLRHSIYRAGYCQANSTTCTNPENLLVPTNPVTGDSADVNAYQRGGILVREYRDCGIKGVDHGPCAVVVNPSRNGASVPQLAHSYQHSVQISGYGTMPAISGVNGGQSTAADNGAISANGGAVTRLGATRGTVLFL